MIRALVVEDSPVIREFLVHVLASDPEIEVVGTAGDGEEAIREVQRKNPDVITMDINMPKVDGFRATRQIMETNPTPIVIVTGSWDTKEIATTFRAMEAGALAVVPRPLGLGHPDHHASAQELIRRVKLMSEVKVVRRWGGPARRAEPPAPSPQVDRIPVGRDAQVEIVAIGASTGGPVVVQRILSLLSESFPVPIVIVQHMAAGFVQGFVEWLGETTGYRVRVACQGEPLEPGRAHVAPDGFHMGVTKRGRLLLAAEAPENGLRPSVSYLFRSVADVYGKRAAAVLLTGMGKDGAEELKRLKDGGAITFAQDEASSVVFGMPGEAIRLGGASYVLSPDGVASALRRLVARP